MNRRLIPEAIRFYLFNSLVTHIPSYMVRHWYVRALLGISFDPTASLHMGTFITGRGVVVGSTTVINRGCFLDGRSELVVGSNVSLGVGTALLTMTHATQSPDFAPVFSKTVVKDYVWTGVRALLLPGVTIETGAVIGAGSVVTRNVEAYAIVAGNPARVIGERNRELTYTLSYRPFFNTDIE